MSKDQEIKTAIDTIIYYLTEEIIVEECEGNGTLGCASCHAIEMRRSLLMLANLVNEFDDIQGTC